MTYFLNGNKCAVLPVFQKYVFTQQEADRCVWLTCEHSPLDTLTKAQVHMHGSWSIRDAFSDGAQWQIQCWDVMDMSVREFLDGINWGQKTSCLRPLHGLSEKEKVSRAPAFFPIADTMWPAAPCFHYHNDGVPGTTRYLLNEQLNNLTFGMQCFTMESSPHHECTLVFLATWMFAKPLLLCWGLEF